MRTTLTLTAALLLSSCAGVGSPGYMVSEDVAHRWGCNTVIVQRAAEVAAQELTPGHVWVPQVGWDGCDLLARVGAPREYERQQSRYGRSASLWYGTPSSPKLVRMEQVDEANNKWQIVYVSW